MAQGFIVGAGWVSPAPGWWVDTNWPVLVSIHHDASQHYVLTLLGPEGVLAAEIQPDMVRELLRLSTDDLREQLVRIGYLVHGPDGQMDVTPSWERREEVNL